MEIVINWFLFETPKVNNIAEDSRILSIQF